jgi:hypothetical protein
MKVDIDSNARLSGSALESALNGAWNEFVWRPHKEENKIWLVGHPSVH